MAQEEIVEETAPNINRRNFLSVATWGIAALMAIGFAVPSLIYIIGNALKRELAEAWVRLGSTSKVEVGVPTLFTFTIERQTGWIVNQEEVSVYVLTENGRDYIAMSNICTHLACRVRWINDQNQFFCPCHNGVFDTQGLVISGPPPRPMDRYEVKVEENQIFIKVA
jgi:Rieske Fe-S protein